ncbi:hypothetical protein Selin_1416 [Desulfurispirillum indicum S5]|uniref:Uncharacterized protein n=1 Tax=Desulfurispirillum indicum (strain ATCC BAA-1389 / DSM 22839 / S5) TaxID=653733 RepID=E6W6B5_DESIS|nr:hypothetical protein [Desulfurispirillum indicum]ADU66151.1 hypothetical protein Selin_1416 [Desulfurispirillum indicum S5]
MQSEEWKRKRRAHIAFALSLQGETLTSWAKKHGYTRCQVTDAVNCRTRKADIEQKLRDELGDQVPEWCFRKVEKRMQYVCAP